MALPVLAAVTVAVAVAVCVAVPVPVAVAASPAAGVASAPTMQIVSQPARGHQVRVLSSSISAND